MQKHLKNILPCLLIIFGVLLYTHQAQAGWVDWAFGDVFSGIMAWVANGLLFLASWWVAITGALLNISISLTLHIKDFVSATSGVYLVWQTIRDVSGMMIIFFLLFASFKVILSQDSSAGVGKLVKDIVIAGILINFSFFIVSTLIDASNIVSLSIYNAITPASTTWSIQQDPYAMASSAINDGGISNIFMQSLQIQKIYSGNDLSKLTTTGNNTAAVVATPFVILIKGVVGAIVMIVAGLSFLLAALAFTSRLVILIFLLAFSPIWFVTRVVNFPQLQEYSKDFTKHLKAQLLFMPAYLLLLYAALLILTKGGFGQGAGIDISNDSNLVVSLVALVINYVIVIIMLNLPLVVAFSLSNSKVLGDLGKNWDARKIWKGVGIRTAGRAAFAANERRTVARIASTSPLAGRLVSDGLSKVSSSGFGLGKGKGYDSVLTAKNKEREKMNKLIGTVDESKYDKTTEEGRVALAREKDFRKGLQVKYRSALPWKAKATNLGLGGVIGFMVDNRANRQTSGKLTDAAGKEDKKQAQKKDTKRLEEITKEKARIQADLNIHNDLGVNESTNEDLMGIDILEKNLNRLKEEENLIRENMAARKGDLDEILENERIEKTANSFAEKTKSEGGGGGGGSGGEKKEGGKEEK